MDRPRWILEISKGVVFYLMFPDVPGTRNFQIFLGRGTGEGDRKGGMAAAGWAWQQEGGYDLVGHVPCCRMVAFGRILTKLEGDGVETVQNESI